MPLTSLGRRRRTAQRQEATAVLGRPNDALLHGGLCLALAASGSFGEALRLGREVGGASLREQVEPAEVASNGWMVDGCSCFGMLLASLAIALTCSDYWFSSCFNVRGWVVSVPSVCFLFAFLDKCPIFDRLCPEFV